MISAEEFLSSHEQMVREPSAPNSSNRGVPGKLPTKERRRKLSGGFAYLVAADPHDEDECKESALRLLDAAARSSGSLRDKLAEREYDAEVIERVVTRLEELGLIDDEEYARNVIRSCTARMMGARGVMRELVRKGVPRPLAERMVRQTAQAGVFEDCAWELGRTVVKKNAGKDVEVCKRRFWSAGGRKGHAPEDLRAVSDELFRHRIDE